MVSLSFGMSMLMLIFMDMLVKILMGINDRP
jgi:hypothetical protein